MPPRIPDYTWTRIVNLHLQGFSKVNVVKTLLQEGLQVTYRGVSGVIDRYGKHGLICDSHRRGRRKRIDVTEIIDKNLKANDELTASDLQTIIFKETGTRLSLSSIKNKRAKLGWKCSGRKSCQMIRKVNQRKRLEFAITCVKNEDKFANVIFTDESTIELDQHAAITFWKPGDPNGQHRLKPKAKHPTKVHVWAGISSEGATPIQIFRGIMDSQYYVEEILQNTLLPFVEQTFPGGNYRFMQDNDPKHRSNLAMTFMREKNINYWPTAPESPDINPIENVWHELKHFLRKVHKPSNQDELVQGIQEFWQTKMTIEKCRTYISHLRKVVPAVILKKGAATGF
ncbi:Transposable element Tcb1 transposase [Holothuria leucospilota]|uniref:Transposable element Tcb1 transposase n=1 Tax=Holothuria leucospilota TaxID=206669 RepID=A0A9Q1CQK9_HOLLE|nr:Transposable element Tcb1 transposase [Holothuria leucospilota]